jgi:hypothetical protein
VDKVEQVVAAEEVADKAAEAAGAGIAEKRWVPGASVYAPTAEKKLDMSSASPAIL